MAVRSARNARLRRRSRRLAPVWDGREVIAIPGRGEITCEAYAAKIAELMARVDRLPRPMREHFKTTGEFPPKL
jgi:hypothetical protein